MYSSYCSATNIQQLIRYRIDAYLHPWGCHLGPLHHQLIICAIQEAGKGVRMLDELKVWNVGDTTPCVRVGDN